MLTIKALLDDDHDDADPGDTNAPAAPSSSPRVVLADAPLVEGAVAAVVTAAAGADLAAVLASAEEARSYRKL